jgi:nicotinate-nucleotide--dimethylbenzimidazole phosphoribosyltransferase
MPILPEIPAFDEDTAARARRHQLTLTKPPGSLGRLEDLAVFYAGVRGQFPAAIPGRAELFVFAADHGVAAEGVSAYPAEVTAAMVGNFLHGGAAVNVLARQCGVSVTVVDVGVSGGSEPRSDLAPARDPDGPLFVSARVAPGTRNLRREAALTAAEAEAALSVGLSMAAAAAARGAELLVGGDMGIANTTSAAALVCAICDEDPAGIVGRGTGVDDDGLARKIEVIRDALALHRALLDGPAGRPFGALQAVGGLEIAALAGLMLGGAARRLPVIVDGFIAGAAALVACGLVPGVRSFLLLSHLSAERGARRLAALLGGPAPLIDLGLRLGEGTGATLVVPLVRAAVALQNQMATFAGAGVPERAAAPRTVPSE